MNLIVVAGTMFAAYILALVVILLLTRRLVVGSGQVRIVINGDESSALTAERGGSLLNALRANSILVPAACGGKATCGMCRVHVESGGGQLTATEQSHINRAEARQGERLACMVRLREDLHIEVPKEVLSIAEWDCTVRSNRNVASFIKEVILELPQGAPAGGTQ